MSTFLLMRRALPSSQYPPDACAALNYQLHVGKSKEPPMYYAIQGTKLRLLASLHPVPANRPEMPDFVERGYAECERLAFEMNTASPDLQRHINLPDGQQLDQRVPATLLQHIQSVWPATHPFGPLRNQSLWLLALRIPLLNLTLAPGLAPGVDPILAGRAKTDNKSAHFLETPTEFAGAATSIEDDQYFELFDAMLARLPQSVGRFLALHDAWIAGDPRGFEKELEIEQRMLPPPIKTVLFDQRNAAWLPRLLKFAKEPESTLVVVGAAHLYGERGLIGRLEQQGYEVAPAL
jgi:uncharacterized protein